MNEPGHRVVWAGRWEETGRCRAGACVGSRYRGTHDIVVLALEPLYVFKGFRGDEGQHHLGEAETTADGSAVSACCRGCEQGTWSSHARS